MTFTPFSLRPASSLIRLFSALALLAALSAQERPPTRPPGQNRRGFNTRDFLGLGPAPDAVAAERGEKLYAPNCAFCHGAKATGGEAGPDLVRSALVLHDEKGELVGPVISKGRPDRGMPAFPSFTEAQTADIAQFLHLRVEFAVNRGLYKVQNVITGDARAGAAYFNGEGKCNTCHSPTGDLAKIATKFGPSDLQAQLLYPGASPRVEKVTVTPPSGPAISGTLKRLDDFEVSLYDAQGQYRSWPRDKVKVEVEDRLVFHRQQLDRYTDADMHNMLAYLETLK